VSTIELKSNIHKIVDKIQNEQFLQNLYDFLVVKENSVEGKLWRSLTEAQKQEVLASYEESENESNLLEKDKLFEGD
jgi:cell fate regulator YaaT (PSP1 superfamily)